MRRHVPGRARRDAGFTLVEVLVALVIGMLVVLAAVASLLGTRRTALTGGDVDELHQASVLAFRVLGQQIRQAGYFPIDPSESSFYFDVGRPTGLESDPVFFAIKGQEAQKASEQDSLRIGYAPNPDHQKDCIGQLAGGANVRLITNEFSVKDGVLRCKGSGSATAQPIVSGVERFDVQYGIGAGDAERVASYVDAAAAGDFKQVRTVRVCLQLVGTSRGNPGGSHLDCDGSQQTSRDGRLRRSYTAVFALRNR